MVPRISANTATAVSFAVGTAIITLCVFQAAVSSITHDEASTYLNYVSIRTPLWSCASDPACWGNANNHILNTLFVRWSADVFGPSVFALRLPNLVFLAAFVAAVLRATASLTSTRAVRIAGVCLFLCNPYVLDFFCVARGYGIGLACAMISWTSLLEYLRTKRSWLVLVTWGFACASVFANLIYLVFFAALGAVYGGLLLSRIRRRFPNTKSGLYTEIAIPALTTALVVYFFIRPIGYLSEKGEFLYGAGSILASYRDFVENSLYGAAYARGAGLSIFFAISVLALVLSAILILRYSNGQSHGSDRSSERSACLALAVLIVVFLIANNLANGALYPIGRKNMIYHLPVAFVILCGLDRLNHFFSRDVQTGISLAASALLLIHLLTAYDGHQTREWWYDRHTFEMASDVSASCPKPTETCSLTVDWVFHPSTDFYARTSFPEIALAPYSKEIRISDAIDFLYLQPGQELSDDSGFRLQREYGGNLLFRNERRPMQ